MAFPTTDPIAYVADSRPSRVAGTPRADAGAVVPGASLTLGDDPAYRLDDVRDVVV